MMQYKNPERVGHAQMGAVRVTKDTLEGAARIMSETGTLKGRWQNKMLEEYGAQIRPHLKAFWTFLNRADKANFNRYLDQGGFAEAEVESFVDESDNIGVQPTKEKVGSQASHITITEGTLRKAAGILADNFTLRRDYREKFWAHCMAQEFGEGITPLLPGIWRFLAGGKRENWKQRLRNFSFPPETVASLIEELENLNHLEQNEADVKRPNAMPDGAPCPNILSNEDARRNLEAEVERGPGRAPTPCDKSGVRYCQKPQNETERSESKGVAKRVWFPQLLATVFLLVALNPANPYGYYIVLRWVCCISFGYVAVQAYWQSRRRWALLLAIAAAIYNPLLPVHLTREIWLFLNVATILLALASAGIVRYSD